MHDYTDFCSALGSLRSPHLDLAAARASSDKPVAIQRLRIFDSTFVTPTGTHRPSGAPVSLHLMR